MRVIVDKTIWNHIGRTGQLNIGAVLRRGLTYKENLQSAHAEAMNNRRALEKSQYASCFYCCRSWVYGSPPAKEWIDEGTTAMCPTCGIDTVLAGLYSDDFLKELHAYWFDCSA